MRIAFFHNLPSGGAKRCAFEIITLLSKSHTIDLYTYDNSSEDFLDIGKLTRNHFIAKKSKIVANKGVFRFFNLIRANIFSIKLANLINNGGYDIALVMQCKVTNSPYLLKYLNIPSVYFCHEPFAKILEPHYFNNNSNNIVAFLKKQFINILVNIDKKNALKATSICTSSIYCIENLYRNYGRYAKLNYLGVNSDFFRKKNIERKDYVLSVGSLNMAKAQDFIIESVGSMKNKPKIRFIYNFSYGEIKFKEYLQILANRLDVQITFEEMASDDDLLIAYNQAIATVFPSRLEPLGLVPLESMSCGTPVIGVSEGGIRETIQNNINGLLTERDPIKFGQAIHNLMIDQSLWNKLSENGIRNVQNNWTWSNSVNRLELFLEEVLHNHNNKI